MNQEFGSIYQKQLLELANDKKHYHRPENYDLKVLAHNPLCGDKFDFYIKLNPNDSSALDSIYFDGDGCLISKASANLLCDNLNNISSLKEKVKDLEKYLSDESNSVSNSGWDVFLPIKNYPLRHRCILLAWEALNKSL